MFDVQKLMFLLIFLLFISYLKASSFSKQLSFYFIYFTFIQMPQLFFHRTQRSIWSPVERLRWRFFAKIVKGFCALTIFAERLSRGCSTGSKYSSRTNSF